jgi:hypothetical protein
MTISDLGSVLAKLATVGILGGGFLLGLPPMACAIVAAVVVFGLYMTMAER